MKNSVLMLMVCAVMAFGLTVATPGWAASDQTEAATTKKTTRHKRAPVLPPSDFVGRVPNSCDYDRAAGRCVIDLGYGRCMECNSGPFK